MTLSVLKASRLSKIADQQASISRWARDMFIKTGQISYMQAYNESQARAAHCYNGSMLIRKVS